MSFTYCIYGFQIESSRKINLLVESSAISEPDLSIFWETELSAVPNSDIIWNKIESAQLTERLGIQMWQAADVQSKTFTKFRFNTKDFYFDFLFDSQKNKLWIVHAKEELEGDLDSYFVGPVLGCILRLRGVVCLHACVVAIENEAIALAGHKGFGKSTTAAGFARAGFAVVSDDLAAIEAQGEDFLVRPGYPQLRLRTNSVEALFNESENLSKVYSFLDKQYVTAKEGGSFCDKTLPITAIYILDRKEDEYLTPFIEELVMPEKFIKLVENAYASYALTNDLRRQEFFQLSELCQRVPIRRLVFGNDLNKLAMQIQAIVKDFKAQTKKAHRAQTTFSG